MNNHRTSDQGPLERRVATWMANAGDVSAAAAEHDIDRILTATSRVRPYPRWLALLKESPMGTTTEAGPRVTVGSPARALAIALLLVALLAALGVGAFASGILDPVVAPPAPPAPLSVLAWRQTVTAGSFAPLANLSRDEQGRIWVVDSGSSRFAIYRPDGTFVEHWKPGDGPPLNLVRENGDTYGSIAFASDGSRYVLDVGNYRVVAYSASGQFRGSWVVKEEGSLADPVGIAIRPDDTVAVFDDLRAVIETYDRDGTLVASVNVKPAIGGGFNTANAFAFDAAGNVYISQVNGERAGQVTKLSPSGQPLQVFGATEEHKFQEQPGAIAIDPAGHLFVAQGPFRIDAPGVLIFAPNGSYVGGLGADGSPEGRLGFPSGILIDANGNLVVADSGTPDKGTFANPALLGFKINLPATP
jgi:sugar lactone lactonase YvrE